MLCHLTPQLSLAFFLFLSFYFLSPGLENASVLCSLVRCLFGLVWDRLSWEALTGLFAVDSPSLHSQPASPPSPPTARLSETEKCQPGTRHSALFLVAEKQEINAMKFSCIVFLFESAAGMYVWQESFKKYDASYFCKQTLIYRDGGGD